MIRRNVYTPDSSHESNWDFDLLDSKLTSIPVSTTNSTATPTSHADPFEVEALTQNETFDLRYSTDQDDNPLGILAQPANVLTNQNKDEVKPDNNLEAVEHIQDTPNESTLPPNEDDEDAKLAQLIEMGFSLQQSKFALEATLGQDIQAAINLLVQNSETAQRLQPNQSDNRRPIVQNERTRNAESHAQQPEMRREVGSRPSGKNDDNIQIQTEKLVMQAQELGGFLYKNAASYFKASRDKVTKAVGDWQEQQRTQRLEEHKGPIRPKWMTGDNDTVDLSTGSVERFKDDDDDAEAEMSSRMAERRRVEEIERQKKIKQRETAAIAHKARQQQQLKKDLLFDDDQTTYVSPSRRRAATPKNDGSMSPSFSNGSPNKTSLPLSQKPAPEITSPKANRPTRPIINVPADVLTKANNFRNSGNEKFKIGQFGEAEAAYSEAINVLPSGYDLQILLYNNRAATRLKNGDYKKCIEDCDLAFELCKQNGDGSVVIENIDIQYRDQLVKSLYRKAEALENIEKYNDALATCELLIKYEGTSNSNINQRMSRCRQALNPKSISKPKNTSPQVPKSQKPGDLMAMFDPTAASSNPPSLVVSEEELSKSKAVTAMRAKAAEKEAEDAEKLQKVDDVNARILAWKAGKEQNLRALLATLDSLLWPGAQWKGAQMSELINPKKCKITYMKAISKVHPDKVRNEHLFKFTMKVTMLIYSFQRILL